MQNSPPESSQINPKMVYFQLEIIQAMKFWSDDKG